MSINLWRITILCLLLNGLLVGSVMSAPSDDPCKGKKSDRPADCGGEETPGGEHNSLLVTLGDADGSSDQVYGDGSAVYSDSEKTVTAQLGGQTQPNKPGFSVSLKRAGKNPRTITTELICVGLPGGPDNCVDLPLSVITDDQMSLGIRPYELNCPEVLESGECPDVFTMGTAPENSELMSFRANYWNHNIFVEAASSIGGDGSLSPGRCLSLLDESQRNTFLAEYCTTPGNCNVSVTAYDEGDSSEAGAGDGENDEWLVTADGVLAIICGQLSGSEIVYGMTTLGFDIHAIKE